VLIIVLMGSQIVQITIYCLKRPEDSGASTGKEINVEKMDFFLSFKKNDHWCFVLEKIIRYITSDCDAVAIIHDDQGYAKSPEDAVADVLKAGIVTLSFSMAILELVLVCKLNEHIK